MTTKNNIHSVFSKVILCILFLQKTAKFHVFFLIGKRLAGLMIQYIFLMPRLLIFITEKQGKPLALWSLRQTVWILLR